MIEIKTATKTSDHVIIERLAKEILHEVYDPILPTEHTDFFLNRFQSVQAIKNQINNKNYFYYLLNFNDKSVGYLGIQKLNNKLVLSKIYILKSYRGKKIGKAALEFVNKFAINNNSEKIELTVNQQNLNTIDIYKRSGYKIRESVLNSFDDGYSVKDYIMEKYLT